MCAFEVGIGEACAVFAAVGACFDVVFARCGVAFVERDAVFGADVLRAFEVGVWVGIALGIFATIGAWFVGKLPRFCIASLENEPIGIADALRALGWSGRRGIGGAIVVVAAAGGAEG